MIGCQEFYSELRRSGVGFFSGVPDSLLKDICAYIQDHASSREHIPAANEGAALALATGHHLATGDIGLVYLQNSGLGNAVNPLTSLVDPVVYSIPVLLLVGWRGEPGVADEPQHLKQGAVTLETLEVLGVPYTILPDTPHEAASVVHEAVEVARKRQGPFALVVRKGTFSAYKPASFPLNPGSLTREDAIAVILDSVGPSDVIVSTTGMASREVFEHRARNGGHHGQDFLTVGSMGHASQIALGIAAARPDRTVYCLDGDGAWIMHMGGAAIAGGLRLDNFKHVVLNNGAHDSVGGQPTTGFQIDIPAIARACGYDSADSVATETELIRNFSNFAALPGPSLLEVRVRRGARPDLGRPTQSPMQNKTAFMAALAEANSHVGV